MGFACWGRVCACALAGFHCDARMYVASTIAVMVTGSGSAGMSCAVSGVVSGSAGLFGVLLRCSMSVIDSRPLMRSPRASA